jgi:shikimate kinase
MHVQHANPVPVLAPLPRQRVAAPPSCRTRTPKGPPSSSLWQPRAAKYATKRSITARVAFPPGPPPGSSPEQFAEDNKAYAEIASKIEAAAATTIESLQGTSVYLVGMMGSGKSTIGKMLSQALQYCYFDTDSLIEQLAGKSIPEIFEQDGEEAFRALETQVLQELAPYKDCVISTGGGAPTKAVNWGHMHAGISVWLNGPPTLLARRVVRDGTEGRPLLSATQGGSGQDGQGGEQVENGDAAYERTLERLKGLLEERREQYGFADLMVSLEGEDPATADLGAPAAVVVHRVLSAISHRVERDAAWREERRNFEVVNENLPPTMRVVKSINPVADEVDPYLP